MDVSTSQERNPATNEPRGSRRFGIVAVAIVIAEILVIAGGCGIIRLLGLWGHAPEWLEVLFKFMYVAGFGGLILAIVGLSQDDEKAYAGLALILALVSLGAFGLIFAI
jgi:hypothetical protein